MLFYELGMLLLSSGFLFGLFLVWEQFAGVGVSGAQSVLVALAISTGLQFLFFVMLFDMQETKKGS